MCRALCDSKGSIQPSAMAGRPPSRLHLGGKSLCHPGCPSCLARRCFFAFGIARCPRRLGKSLQVDPMSLWGFGESPPRHPGVLRGRPRVLLSLVQRVHVAWLHKSQRMPAHASAHSASLYLCRSALVPLCPEDALLEALSGLSCPAVRTDPGTRRLFQGASGTQVGRRFLCNAVAPFRARVKVGSSLSASFSCWLVAFVVLIQPLWFAGTRAKNALIFNATRPAAAWPNAAPGEGADVGGGGEVGACTQLQNAPMPGLPGQENAR